MISVTLDGHQSNQAAVKIPGTKLKSDISSAFLHPAISMRIVRIDCIVDARSKFCDMTGTSESVAFFLPNGTYLPDAWSLAQALQETGFRRTLEVNAKVKMSFRLEMLGFGSSKHDFKAAPQLTMLEINAEAKMSFHLEMLGFGSSKHDFKAAPQLTPAELREEMITALGLTHIDFALFLNGDELNQNTLFSELPANSNLMMDPRVKVCIRSSQDDTEEEPLTIECLASMTIEEIKTKLKLQDKLFFYGFYD